MTHLKIVDYYDKITMESLVHDEHEMQLKLVPSMISWLAKHCNKHNALFDFVRNQSYLIDVAWKNASVGYNNPAEDKNNRNEQKPGNQLIIGCHLGYLSRILCRCLTSVITQT